MAQRKTPQKLGNLQSNIRQSQSLLNVNELDTRNKATVKDLEELYTALQGLVPKKSPHHGGLRTNERKARSGPSGTDTDSDKPTGFRRCHSEKYPKKQHWDTNMNVVTARPSARKPVWEKPVPEKPALRKTFSDERHVASDTEVELKDITDGPQRLQRQLSLPAYDEDEIIDEKYGSQKRSKFRIFRRHRQPKTKKKSSSWRSFFSTLSLKRRRSKKNGKNKIGYSTNPKTAQIGGNRTPKLQTKNESLPKQERTPKSTPRQSFSVNEKMGINPEMRKSGRKRQAPEPPSGDAASSFQIETPNVGVEDVQPRERSDTLETKSDLVQKKISAWYKHAVKETNSVTLKEPLRATRSHENLLTDSEIMRKRGTFSSDTDSTSVSGGDRNRVNHIPKTRVRKTRARRNRRRERARFYSCPNVKLVSKALEEAEKKAPQLTTDLNSTTTDGDRTNNVPETSHATTVKPVEAKLSFGSSLDNDEPMTDFMKLQNAYARNWLTRQCSKTTIGCIRPLQLNLFYSESPSRETVFRSRSMIHRPRVHDGKELGVGSPQEFAFKIRRSSSRRRKRRSFKRGQTRLPHQSPFYVPPSSLKPTPKDQPEEDSRISKDSGLGSPDVNDEKRFATFPVMKRQQRLAKLHSESEDSGWASSHRHCANTSETGIQTDPVIVMTAVSKAYRPVLPPTTDDESEA